MDRRDAERAAAGRARGAPGQPTGGAPTQPGGPAKGREPMKAERAAEIVQQAADAAAGVAG
eukprot:4745992-Prymnesium_polylepis.1